MCTNEYQEIVNELIFMKNPYDGDDESYELSFINRKKELEEQINLLNTKYETDLEELEYIYFGYHSHYHQTINNLLEQLNDTNYIFNPGEKVYIESQILANKKKYNLIKYMKTMCFLSDKKYLIYKLYMNKVYIIKYIKLMI